MSLFRNKREYIAPDGEQLKEQEALQRMEAIVRSGAKSRSRFNRFPMHVVLVEPRAGSGKYFFFDKIGRFKKPLGLGFEYRLKKKKKKLPTSLFENIIESNKGKILMIDHPEEDVFRPMQINNGTIDSKETAWKETFMNNVEKAHQLLTRRGFMERYMPLILLIVFGVMMIMALYVVRQDIGEIIVQVQQAVGSATSAANIAAPPL